MKTIERREFKGNVILLIILHSLGTFCTPRLRLCRVPGSVSFDDRLVAIGATTNPDHVVGARVIWFQGPKDR